MALWANLHGGFTLGLAVAGVLAAEAVWEADRDQRKRATVRWGVFLVVAVGAACITPYGYQPLLITFKLYANQPVQYIREWAPLSAKNDPVVEVTFVLLLFLALYFGVRIKFWRLLITIGLVHLTFQHVRMTPMFALIAPIVLASSLAAQFKFLNLRAQITSDPQFFAFARRVTKPPMYAFLLVGVLVTAILYVSRSDPRPPQEAVPEGAVNYLENSRYAGRVYNAYEFSGYLIFRGVKTFVDSRIDQLFAGGFFEKTLVAARLNAGLKEILDQYGVSVALVKPESVEANQLKHDPDWSELYADKTAVLYGRRSGAIDKRGSHD